MYAACEGEMCAKCDTCLTHCVRILIIRHSLSCSLPPPHPLSCSLPPPHPLCSIVLDKRFRTECSPHKFSHPPPNRYVTILKQRHVQLLGRSLDLNALLSQRMGSNLIKAIDLTIAKFESSDLCGIVVRGWCFNVAVPAGFPLNCM